ncbi:MAG: competence protein ComE [Cyanobacteria bacterium REEB459]|nr:competence protein ComE [Cyanobacteria bacterium REEB459]
MSPVFRNPWAAGFLIGLIVTVALSDYGRSLAPLPTLTPLVQDSFVRVYFNQSQAGVYRDPYRHLTRYGDNLEQVIIDAIDSAQHSIEVAVQELNLPGIAAALARRHRQGVTVRVVLEHRYSQSISHRGGDLGADLNDYERNKIQDLYEFIDENQDGLLSPGELATRDALTMLDQAHIDRLDDRADGSQGTGLMHHKFMVVDGERVITGSANWTMSCLHGDFLQPDSRGNANNLVVIRSSSLARVFQREFNYLWGDGPGGLADSRFGLNKPYRPPVMVSLPGSMITVQFSPTAASHPWSQTVNGLVAKTLRGTRHSLSLALFVFSDSGLSHHLWQLAQAGVRIRALIDASFAYRSYSEALDMLGLALPDHRCHWEANNQPWSHALSTVGIPTLAETDKLHHKFAVLDGEWVITGSQNWSQAANYSNDENLLVIHSSRVAAHYQREFDRLYSQARLGITPDLQRAIARQRSRCHL